MRVRYIGNTARDFRRTIESMRRVAVTGGIACGKSLVAQLFSERGIPVCEADTLAHALMRRGEEVFDAVVAEFGVAILDGEGQIDRRTLGAIVFREKDRLQRLNALVHPRVRLAWQRWLDAQSAPAACVVIPLLYEVGEGPAWDAVVCVAAPRRLQLQRLESRGLSGPEARARIEAQMPLVEKMERADYVVFNGGSRSLLEAQTERVIEHIRGA